jgi:hypothetical protein
MDYNQLLTSLQDTLGNTLPSLGGALLILVLGWLVALVVRAAIRRGLGALGVNERLRSTTDVQVDLEGGTARITYYVLLAVVLLAFFNALDLERVSGPFEAIVEQIFAFLPKLVGASALLLVAWVIGIVLRALATQGLAATRLDERLGAEGDVRSVGESLGNVLFWLVFLLFLPAILGALEMQGLLGPVESMVDQILGMLPNVFGAAIIGVVGWFVARILRDLVANLLAAAGADRLGERAGLRSTSSLSQLVGLLVYIFVLVPALIAALNVLQIEAISAPATEMLEAFMAAVPNIFGAAIILAVAYIASRFIANLLASLLGGMGFDQLPARLGVGAVLPADTAPSELVGRILVFFVMLFAVVEAAGRLGFEQVSVLVGTLIAFGANVLLGLVIIAVGFWISNLARDAVARVSGDGTATVANVARFGILGIVIAMGLRAMGLADDIVNLAFGLTLGAVAVAVALSFGLGGREAAGRQMEHWLGRLRGQ